MYSTVAILKNSKASGRLVGTHQKLDKIARKCLSQHLRQLAGATNLSTRHHSPEVAQNLSPWYHPKNPEDAPSSRPYFPSASEILYFEGARGPDGIKRKSPGVDEPSHFIIPEKPETHAHLLTILRDHQHNLRTALRANNHVRAAFEAAWLAHAIADGLTPAHHFPLSEAASELMSDKEFITIFGSPVKGIMRGEDFLATVRNNWRYWGTNGYMSKHIAFEYGVAMVATAVPNSDLAPEIPAEDFQNVDLVAEFMRALYRIHDLDMYNRFRLDGWTRELAQETTEVLLPEVVRVITLGWASGLEGEDGLEGGLT